MVHKIVFFPDKTSRATRRRTQAIANHYLLHANPKRKDLTFEVLDKQRNPISHVEKRLRLFQKYCVCKHLIQKNIIHNEFRILKNIVTYETRESKKDYFKNYFEKNKNDKSLIWKCIPQLITLKHKSKRQPSVFTVKGKNDTNLKNIANTFKNYFTELRPKLSKTILQSKKNFKNFLNNSSLKSDSHLPKKCVLFALLKAF